MAPSTTSAPSLPRDSLYRQSSAIRTGCANERPSGSVRGVSRTVISLPGSNYGPNRGCECNRLWLLTTVTEPSGTIGGQRQVARAGVELLAHDSNQKIQNCLKRSTP